MADAPEEAELEKLRSAGAARAEVLGEVFQSYQPRLLRMIEVRMHPALRGRLDAADVLQEAFLEASSRLDDYLEDPRLPPFLWIRGLTGQKLIDQYRRQLQAAKRDARRQLSLELPIGPSGGGPGASSVVLADLLAGHETSPTGRAARNELRDSLVSALDQMTATDREVLVLRHFEQLDNGQTALLLGLSKTAASNRYVRALRRLREVLGAPTPVDGEPA